MGTTAYGSVAYNYSIGKYDVTAGQYAAFLNAVACGHLPLYEVTAPLWPAGPHRKERRERDVLLSLTNVPALVFHPNVKNQ